MLQVWREDDMQEQVREWLEQGKVDIFLGYKKIQGHPLPYCFTKDNLDEISELIVSEARYSLEKMATKIAAEKLAESYHRAFDLPVTVVRPRISQSCMPPRYHLIFSAG